jgi:hypothetical protein
MDNPEKLTTLGTQDAEKQKNTTQYMLDTTMRKQTQNKGLSFCPLSLG